MASKYGADVEQLRQLAQQMNTASDRLERDRLTVGHQIKISAWVGPFATTFKARWESEHSLHVASVVRVLKENATHLRKNADEQEAASRRRRAPQTVVRLQVLETVQTQDHPKSGIATWHLIQLEASGTS